MAHKGSCLCEAVSYTVVGPPTLQYLCHCRNCQKLSGGAFNANCFFPRSSFKVTTGQQHLSIYHCEVTGSGLITHRHFCGKCGTPLFIYPDSKPDVVVVMAGTLDEFDAFEPKQETWVSHRRDWVKGVEGAECFAQSRPISSGRPPKE